LSSKSDQSPSGAPIDNRITRTANHFKEHSMTTLETSTRPTSTFTLDAFDALDPNTQRSESAEQGGEAPGVPTLAGKSVAFVLNGMGSALVLHEALDHRLRQRFGTAESLVVRKPSVSVAPSASDWEAIKEGADAGVALFGGCGSCASRSTRDAIEMEWAGIPSVVIVHSALAGSAQAMRRMSKMDDYPLLEVGYPMGPTTVWTPEQIESTADALLPQIVARLVGARVAS
jgi:hypothetical protein